MVVGGTGRATDTSARPPCPRDLDDIKCTDTLAAGRPWKADGPAAGLAALSAPTVLALHGRGAGGQSMSYNLSRHPSGRWIARSSDVTAIPGCVRFFCAAENDALGGDGDGKRETGSGKRRERGRGEGLCRWASEGRRAEGEGEAQQQPTSRPCTRQCVIAGPEMFAVFAGHLST